MHENSSGEDEGGATRESGSSNGPEWPMSVYLVGGNFAVASLVVYFYR